jgi:hypothetical protein
MAEFELVGGRLLAAARATRCGSGARLAMHLRPHMLRRRLRLLHAQMTRAVAGSRDASTETILVPESAAADS